MTSYAVIHFEAIMKKINDPYKHDQTLLDENIILNVCFIIGRSEEDEKNIFENFCCVPL